MGAALLILRLLERRAGFDPATGLALPTPLRTALAAAAAVFAAAEVIRHRSRSGDTPAFEEAFAAPGGEVLLPVMGAMAMAAGGALLVLESLSPVLFLAGVMAGAVSLLGGGGLLVLVKQLRRDEEPLLLAALPAMFSSVFVVLAIYLPCATDPVLERYWLGVVASAMAAFAFAQLTGFFRKESKPRRFLTVADIAIVLCIACLGESIAPGLRVILGGSAAVLAGFTLMAKED